MARKPQSPWDRMKRFALWQWGLLLIVGGLLANVVTMALQPATGSLTAAQRGQAFGRGLATLLFVIIGVVLIILHFARRKRRP